MTIPFLSNRVTVAERAFLARQLATMLVSGLTIDRAVGILALQTENRYLKKVLQQIQSDLESGVAFSTAIAKHPRVFNKVFLNVVIAGEAVGKVAEVLEEMALRLEKEQEFISKIWSALSYPIFVLIAMVGVGILMMVNIVPQLKEVFADADVELPFVTQLLIIVSDFLTDYWWFALILFVGFVYLVRVWLRTPGGKRLIDLAALHLPIQLIRDYYMSRFTRTLALLTQSGTPIIEALAITGEVMNNDFYGAVIEETKNEIARGVPMSSPLAKSPLFPTIVSQMILVGEQTGRIDDVLLNLADYYEKETEARLKSLSSLFEPIIIIIVGVGVGFLVFSIFIPIYKIASFQ